MIAGKVFTVGSSLVAGTAAGASVAGAVQEHGPVMFPLFGVDIPIVAVAVGMLTAMLVRVISITSSPHRLWSYNAAVTLLAMMGAATFIVDHQTGPGMSFWVGAGFGAVGVGIVEIARSKFGDIIKAVLGQVQANTPQRSDQPGADEP